MDYPPGAPPTPPPSTPTLTCEPEPGTPATTDPAGAVAPPASNGLAAAALDDAAKQQVREGDEGGEEGLAAVGCGEMRLCGGGEAGAVMPPACNGLAAAALDDLAKQQVSGGGRRAGWQLWVVGRCACVVQQGASACREWIYGGGVGPLSKAAGEPGEGGGRAGGCGLWGRLQGWRVWVVGPPAAAEAAGGCHAACREWVGGGSSGRLGEAAGELGEGGGGGCRSCGVWGLILGRARLGEAGVVMLPAAIQGVAAAMNHSASSRLLGERKTLSRHLSCVFCS